MGDRCIISSNCIISNCRLPIGSRVPDSCFLHTIAVNLPSDELNSDIDPSSAEQYTDNFLPKNDSNVETSVGYVCIGMSVEDDVKAIYSKPEQVVWCGQHLPDEVSNNSNDKLHY